MIVVTINGLDGTVTACVGCDVRLSNLHLVQRRRRLLLRVVVVRARSRSSQLGNGKKRSGTTSQHDVRAVERRKQRRTQPNLINLQLVFLSILFEEEL
jgi:hypothetical protein